MGIESRLISAPELPQELRRLPRTVAAELEDHLAEAITSLRRAGLADDEARRRAVAGLGDLAALRRELGALHRDRCWYLARTPWTLRAVGAGWLAFGLVCLAQICRHDSPTYASVAVCLLAGLLASGVGLTLLHRREPFRRVALAVSLFAGVMLAAKALAAPALPVLLPFAPSLLAACSAAALLSAWMLTRPSVRECCA